MHAITLENVTLGYGEKLIFQDFSAQINAGEFIGIFGPNGAGKSTLMRALLRLVKPLSGKILILGKQQQNGNANVGYLSQFRQYASHNNLSARTYLSSAWRGVHWGLPWLNKQEKEQINTVAELTNIHGFIDRPYLQLSGGERQRVALAQALLGNPQILLLDEPLSGLDPAQQDKMVHLVQAIQQRLNIAVLFTAHDLNPLLNVMHRVIYLAHGKAAIGNVTEVVNNETLSWLYDAPIEVVHYQHHLFVFHQHSGTHLYDRHHPLC